MTAAVSANAGRRLFRRTMALPAVLLAAFTFASAPVLAGCRGGRFNNLISKSQEMELGQRAAVEVEEKNRIITAGPDYERLNRVADRIIPLARRDYDVPYSVKLIDSPEVNAFALPGGPIYFYDGLMKMAGNDDQVAAVLGHEAIHIVLRHSVQQLSDQETKRSVAEILLGDTSPVAQSAAGLLVQLQQLSFSRQDEAQADEYGFQYLTEAGYDPDAMAAVFIKLEAQEDKSGDGPIWLQNHPLTEKRVEVAEQRAAQYKRKHGMNE